MGEFAHQPRLAVLPGEGAAVFLVDQYGGDPEKVEFVGAGELVLAGLGALVGVDADAQILPFEG